MLCGKPIVYDFDAYRKHGGGAFACGQCLHCRINKRREWASRILLEAHFTPLPSSFVTLTYNEEHLPREISPLGYPVHSLRPLDFQLWLKRARKYTKLRFFGCGEYGDEGKRPHYHAILFGVPNEQAWSLLRKTWKFGRIDSLPMHDGHARYIAGYTVKKMTKADDERLDGERPEFARQSRIPPVACTKRVLDHLEELHYGRGAAAMMAEKQDVADTVRIGGKLYPLGRTVKNRLRKRLNIPERKKDRYPRPSAWTLEVRDYGKAARDMARREKRQREQKKTKV